MHLPKEGAQSEFENAPLAVSHVSNQHFTLHYTYKERARSLASIHSLGDKFAAGAHTQILSPR